MVPKGYPTPQDRYEEVWWKMPHNMDIIDGSTLWYTPNAKSKKGNYCIFILRASVVCLVPMDLWSQK